MTYTGTFDESQAQQSVFAALIAARRRLGGKREAIIDGDERKLTYDEIVRAAFALGSALRKDTRQGENVGVMLPTGAGAVIAFFALSAYGRIPAMLNFTSGERGLKGALRTAEIKTIVTARRFIELGNLQHLIDALSPHARIVYLEDVREKLSLVDKLAGGIGPFTPWLVRAWPRHQAPAVVLFTSGTEGDPKGVVLSHGNILANVEQVRAHIELFDDDIVFNPLPTFHCFGLTVGAILPLIAGVKAVFHPTPLQAQTIAKRVRETGSTILLSTDTFISQYARAGDQGDLNSLRLAVAGAERVRDETRALVRKKYAIEILEGYGVTEAAPVVAANQLSANRPGTVGKLMANMEYRLEPVEGIAQGGRLFVRGPNIMMGYMLSDRPGEIQPTEDGWHDTGDIVSIDEDGFIAIRGRVKRFAKIGGEMVSLAVVENCASALWPDHLHAAIAIPDGRKGEQVVLLSECATANRADLVGWAQNHGVPELAVPRKIIHIEQVPLLGTGKTDYGSVIRLYEQVAGDAASAPAQAPIEESASTGETEQTVASEREVAVEEPSLPTGDAEDSEKRD
ncbi:MAG: AMP-binding protein [Alphaproteobacteria bacterium]|nr:AMP-binding protein [Alphaproteobacteria bacterium]